MSAKDPKKLTGQTQGMIVLPEQVPLLTPHDAPLEAQNRPLGPEALGLSVAGYVNEKGLSSSRGDSFSWQIQQSSPHVGADLASKSAVKADESPVLFSERMASTVTDELQRPGSVQSAESPGSSQGGRFTFRALPVDGCSF